MHCIKTHESLNIALGLEVYTKLLQVLENVVSFHSARAGAVQKLSKNSRRMPFAQAAAFFKKIQQLEQFRRILAIERLGIFQQMLFSR